MEPALKTLARPNRLHSFGQFHPTKPNRFQLPNQHPFPHQTKSSHSLAVPDPKPSSPTHSPPPLRLRPPSFRPVPIPPNLAEHLGSTPFAFTSEKRQDELGEDTLHQSSPPITATATATSTATLDDYLKKFARRASLALSGTGTGTGTGTGVDSLPPFPSSVSVSVSVSVSTTTSTSSSSSPSFPRSPSRTTEGEDLVVVGGRGAIGDPERTPTSTTFSSRSESVSGSPSPSTSSFTMAVPTPPSQAQSQSELQPFPKRTLTVERIHPPMFELEQHQKYVPRSAYSGDNGDSRSSRDRSFARPPPVKINPSSNSDVGSPRLQSNLSLVGPPSPRSSNTSLFPPFPDYSTASSSSSSSPSYESLPIQSQSRHSSFGNLPTTLEEDVSSTTYYSDRIQQDRDRDRDRSSRAFSIKSSSGSQYSEDEPSSPSSLLLSGFIGMPTGLALGDRGGGGGTSSSSSSGTGSGIGIGKTRKVKWEVTSHSSNSSEHARDDVSWSPGSGIVVVVGDSRRMTVVDGDARRRKASDQSLFDHTDDWDEGVEPSDVKEDTISDAVVSSNANTMTMTGDVSLDASQIPSSSMSSSALTNATSGARVNPSSSPATSVQVTPSTSTSSSFRTNGNFQTKDANTNTDTRANRTESGDANADGKREGGKRERIVTLALGSNLGDRVGNISEALELLNGFNGEGDVRVVDTSFLYESDPMYVEDQPAFLNAACQVSTTLEPMEMLSFVKEIENRMGRVKTMENGPREIDIDILFYEDEKFEHPSLRIPHIRIPERKFVLFPLVDLIPHFMHPSLGREMYKLLSQLRTSTTKEPDPRRMIPFRKSRPDLSIPPCLVDPKRRTLLMGIINVTPDSFSDGGEKFDTGKAVQAAIQMVQEGADILDVGGMSTRPGADDVPEEEEIRRVVPVIRELRENMMTSSTIISVDTFRSKVAEEAINAGADIINDVSGGRLDKGMLETMARLDVPVVLMHSRGDPKTMGSLTEYDDGNVVEGVERELEEMVSDALAKGVKRWNIIVDPGFGFAKDHEGNIALLRHLSKILEEKPHMRRRTVEGSGSNVSLGGFPSLIGLSRKGFLGKIIKKVDPKEREFATAAACTISVAAGADIVRVHDVKHMRDVVKVADAVYKSR